MTIVVPGLERVIVVFPATLDSDVVTVGDVLVAVYSAVQELAAGRHIESASKRGIEGRRDWPTSRQADFKSNTDTTMVIEELGKDHWWMGLYPYHGERDVWVLRTGRVDRR